MLVKVMMTMIIMIVTLAQCIAAPLRNPPIFDIKWQWWPWWQWWQDDSVVSMLIVARRHLWSFRALLMTIVPSRTNLVIVKYFLLICCRDDNHRLTIIVIEHEKFVLFMFHFLFAQYPYFGLFEHSHHHYHHFWCWICEHRALVLISFLPFLSYNSEMLQPFKII